ncbi:MULTISPECIES: HNH endonuclease family protein [unclassified Variovorax]|uniref:HNH endonuclease family protein n=1 Tax=unclassified Variovorax TaxID=663243 RepID=UPI00131789D7|nr:MULTISPECIES: DUF262 domain-containing protein [unclassified Variovorax]VTU41833.1 hypothetical protein H6P1_00055 [Variovorax sp. PBL-H6]VTU44498.1 hypothetical protein SRS16P1_00847 [Variovorax sp. SRS16]VTU44544.1 hypothetical protein E5P1_00840 [Variovorax sp. PBL-E5]
MKIEPRQISIGELVSGYADSGDAGVVGFGGRLNIRPPYQREFVYKDVQRNKVLDTVRKGYPLNVMYWVRNPDPDAPDDEKLASFEVLDGQQRTLSICKYVKGDFSIDEVYFHNLPQDQMDKILEYPLTVYVCEGPESEKLDWFQTINIAGEKLTDQELLNSIFVGPWLLSAKAYFSKPNCPAYQIGSDYMTGSPIRQEYLETALNWIEGGNPRRYMSGHQHDKTAFELWNYFSSVINWVKATFPVVRREMKSVPWGELYNKHKDDDLDPAELETRVVALMKDEDVSRKSGIYSYLITKQERHLNLRAFTDKVKAEAYARQAGACADVTCPDKGRIFKLDEMEGDHVDPWHAGGKSILANCKMLCKSCNRRKGGV